jgi:hypothetical protein
MIGFWIALYTVWTIWRVAEIVNDHKVRRLFWVNTETDATALMARMDLEIARSRSTPPLYNPPLQDYLRSEIKRMSEILEATEGASE